MSIRLFPDSMVPRQRGCLNIFSCMLHIDFLYSVRHPFSMRLLELVIRNKFVFPLQAYSDVVIKM